MLSFHTFVCMVEWLASVTGFIYGLVNTKWWPPLWYVSLIMFFAFPIVNEAFLMLKGRLLRYRVQDKNYLGEDLKKCIPIVYSPDYNMTFCGLERLHPFDSIKYERTWGMLKEYKIVNDDMVIRSPGIPDREFL